MISELLSEGVYSMANKDVGSSANAIVVVNNLITNKTNVIEDNVIAVLGRCKTMLRSHFSNHAHYYFG
jgi:hypothetical protein